MMIAVPADTPDKSPVVEITGATKASLPNQVPPPEISVSVTDAPVHNTPGPAMGDGLGKTDISIVAMHPVGRV